MNPEIEPIDCATECGGFCDETEPTKPDGDVADPVEDFEVAETKEEPPDPSRQRLGLSLLRFLYWFSAPMPGKTPEEQHKAVFMKVLIALCIFAPPESLGKSGASLARLGGVSLEEVVRITGPIRRRLGLAP